MWQEQGDTYSRTKHWCKRLLFTAKFVRKRAVASKNPFVRQACPFGIFCMDFNCYWNRSLYGKVENSFLLTLTRCRTLYLEQEVRKWII